MVSRIEIVKTQFDPPGKDRVDGKWVNLEEEWVELENKGIEPQDMTGWILRDLANYRYKFPAGFTLQPGAKVKVRTGQGDDTETDLYWGYKRPVWNNDYDLATLVPPGRVEFEREAYAVRVRRDYNNRVGITIRNSGEGKDEFYVEVINTHEELRVDFVGEGSRDAPVTLQPGESRLVTLNVHAHDANPAGGKYQIQGVIRSGDGSALDYADIEVEVIRPHYQMHVEDLGRDSNTGGQRLRVSNLGDSITDLYLKVTDGLVPYTMMLPNVQHAYLARGESIEVEVRPIVTDDFPGATGFFYAQQGGGSQVISPLHPLGWPVDVDIVTDFPAGEFLVLPFYDHHCGNARRIYLNFTLPPGFDQDNVNDAKLLIYFNLTGSPGAGQTRIVTCNNHEMYLIDTPAGDVTEGPKPTLNAPATPTNQPNIAVDGSTVANHDVEILVGPYSVGTCTSDGSGNFNMANVPLQSGNNDIRAFLAGRGRIETQAPSGTYIFNIVPNYLNYNGSNQIIIETHINQGSYAQVLNSRIILRLDTNVPGVTVDMATANSQLNGYDQRFTDDDITGMTLSDPVSVVFDGVPPPKPAITTPAGIVNGASLNLDGTAEADAAIAVYRNGDHVTPIANGTAGGGNFSIPLTLLEGNNDLEVRATDAAGNVSVFSDSVNVIYSPPFNPPLVVDVTPDTPDPTQDLVCNITTPTQSGGLTITYSYVWEKNGVLQPGLITNTVPAASTAETDVWKCTVTPHNGFEPGPTADDQVTIGPMPPPTDYLCGDPSPVPDPNMDNWGNESVNRAEPTLQGEGHTVIKELTAINKADFLNQLTSGKNIVHLSGTGTYNGGTGIASLQFADGPITKNDIVFGNTPSDIFFAASSGSAQDTGLIQKFVGTAGTPGATAHYVGYDGSLDEIINEFGDMLQLIDFIDQFYTNYYNYINGGTPPDQSVDNALNDANMGSPSLMLFVAFHRP